MANPLPSTLNQARAFANMLCTEDGTIYVGGGLNQEGLNISYFGTIQKNEDLTNVNGWTDMDPQPGSPFVPALEGQEAMNFYRISP